MLEYPVGKINESVCFYYELLEHFMSVERTLSIIKPDAVAKNVIGQIIARFENAGLKVIAARMMHLSREDAGRFYAVHKERPFSRTWSISWFRALCSFKP